MSSEHPKMPERPPPPSNLPEAVPSSQEEEFTRIYREAYRHIDHGITLVTEGRQAQADAVLQKGLCLIDNALTIKVESFDCSAEKVQQYAEMQMKMRCTRKEVLGHFTDFQTAVGSSSAGVMQPVEDAPPSYDDYLKSLEPGDSAANSLGNTSANSRLSALNPQVQKAAFEEISESPLVTPVMSPQNGEMIFQVENGVQIFFVYADGRVTSPSYPSFLSVFIFPQLIGAATAPDGARGFLQVGEWNYPLIPAKSPVLHAFYGAYMFPDVTNNVPGSSVGIILPDTVDKDTRDLFEKILIELTCYSDQSVPEGVDVDHERQIVQQSTSGLIASGAEAVSKGIIWGAGKLSELISFGSENLKGYVQPEEEKRNVDPKWQTTARDLYTSENIGNEEITQLPEQVKQSTSGIERDKKKQIAKKRKVENLEGEEALTEAITTVDKPHNDNTLFGEYVAMEICQLHSDERKKRLKCNIQKAIIAMGEEEALELSASSSSSTPLHQ